MPLDANMGCDRQAELEDPELEDATLGKEVVEPRVTAVTERWPKTNVAKGPAAHGSPNSCEAKAPCAPLPACFYPCFGPRLQRALCWL